MADAEKSALILMIRKPETIDAYDIKPEMFRTAVFRTAVEKLNEFAEQGGGKIKFRHLLSMMGLPEVAAEQLKNIYLEAKSEMELGDNDEGLIRSDAHTLLTFFEVTRKRMADEAIFKYKEGDLTRKELYSELERIEELGAEKKKTDSKWLDEAARERIESLYRGKPKNRFALSGFRELDNFSKLATGTLNIIAARPSVGKTAFNLNLARNFSNTSGATMDFFSGETKTESLMDRIFAMETQVDAKKFREHDLDEHDLDRVSIQFETIAGRNMCITQMTNHNVFDIRKRVQQSKRERPGEIHVVMIDHLGLIKKHTKESRHDLDVGAITGYLKKMAIEEDIIIILLSQLSRAVEQRDDKRPRLSDLRNSGDIEQDADDVWFLYRDDYYDRETENANVMEVIIAKAREGQLGTVKLRFDKNIQRMVELEYRNFAPPA